MMPLSSLRFSLQRAGSGIIKISWILYCQDDFKEMDIHFKTAEKKIAVTGLLK